MLGRSGIAGVRVLGDGGQGFEGDIQQNRAAFGGQPRLVEAAASFPALPQHAGDEKQQRWKDGDSACENRKV